MRRHWINYHKLLAAVLTVLAATTQTYAADPPLVDIFLADSLYVPGKQLGMGVTIQAGAAAGTPIDGYIGVQQPDGSLLFLIPDFNNPKVIAQVSNVPIPAVTNFSLTDFSGIILDLSLPILPPGDYTLFAFGVTPGANPLAGSAPETSGSLQSAAFPSFGNLLTLFDASRFVTNMAYRKVGYVDRPQLRPADGFDVAGDATPLILIHGFFGSRETWAALENMLKGKPTELLDDGKLRVRPYTFEYSTLQGLFQDRSIESLAEDLKTQLASNGIDGPIIILAHSMGGLVARSFMQDTFTDGLQSGEQILRLITLATPHRGTPLTLIRDAYNAVKFYYGGALDRVLSALHDLYSDNFIDNLGWDCNDVNPFWPIIGNEQCSFNLGLAGVFPVRENEWLRCLNQIECGDASRLTRKMYLDRIIAYGGANKTFKDVEGAMDFMQFLGEKGMYVRFELNDGIVPLESALFLGKDLGISSGLPTREGDNHVEIHDDDTMLQDLVKDITKALPPPPANQAPIISSLTATPTSVLPGGTSTISVSASDPENGNLTYTWSANCGTLSGGSGPGPKTWTAPGSLMTCTVTVSVGDNDPGRSVTKWISISVQPAPPSFLPAPTLLTPTNPATGVSTTPTFTWSAVAGDIGYRIVIAPNSGALPSDPTTGICGGCIHNATTPAGITSYTPGAGVLSTGTTYHWQVHALGSTTFGIWSGAFSFTTQAGPTTLSITTTSLPSATVGIGYAQGVGATGGQTPYDWGASGLPSDLNMNPTTGAIYGTPTVAGTFNVNAMVGDSSSPKKYAEKVLTLTVSPAATPAPTISSITPNPVTGSNSPITFTVSGSNFVSGTKVQVAYASNDYTFVNTNTNASYVNANTLTVPITTLTQADTWRVRVINPDGQTSSGYVNLVVVAPVCTYPGAFSLSATPYWDTGSPHSIAASLSWTSSSNATNGYAIYKDGGNIGAASGTTFLNNPYPPALLAGSSHSYYIVAQNACGNTQSNTVSVTLTAQATVNSGVGLNLRSAAGCLTTACVIAPLLDGTTVTVKGGPTYASVSSTSSGWWWFIQVTSGTYAGYTGWVWGDYLY